MPRYSITVISGVKVFDPVQVELPNLRAVRMRMFKIALSHVESLQSESKFWLMEAVDVSGMIVQSMDFGMETSAPKSAQSLR